MFKVDVVSCQNACSTIDYIALVAILIFVEADSALVNIKERERFYTVYTAPCDTLLHAQS